MTRYILIICLFFLGTAIAQKNTPIIFVHGMLASGDTWSSTINQFRAAGYSENELYVLDWNTLSFNRNKAVAQLDSVVKVACKNTKSKKVNLVGHSAGGGVCTAYIGDKKRVKSVDKYVHLASGNIPLTIGVPTLNLYSPDDLVTGGKDYKHVQNHSIPGLDHYEIATSNATSKVMFQFFNGREFSYGPATERTNLISAKGRVCTLGENRAEAGASIVIVAINQETGQSMPETMKTITADAQGNWGPIQLAHDKVYQFHVTPKSGRTVVYFREPLGRDNHYIYLRTLPTGGFTDAILGDLPKNDLEVALSIFSSNKAVIAGRDELRVNGFDLANEQLASAKKTAIALFMYDAAKDGSGTGAPIERFAAFPFMSGADKKLATDAETLKVSFNSKRLVIPVIPSSEGITVVVFE
jgi:hypothetical protein